MKIILLSGGKGKRLWPISTDEMPKQFITVFDESTSMLKHTYNFIKDQIAKDIYVATCNEYSAEVRKDLNKFNKLILEPTGIGTFAAILNIAVYLILNEKGDYNEIVSVVPVDHEVEDNFYNILFEAQEKLNNHNICLVGIMPTYPSTQYGYILHSNETVDFFKEKPNEEGAIELLNQNALWNSGILVFKVGYIYEIAKKYLKFSSYDEFIKHYTTLPHTSFDVEVLEHEKNIAIIKSKLQWKDLGTWNSLAPLISTPDQYNTNIIDFENKKIKNDGVKDIILINSVNGIKIIPKQNSNVFYRRWGTYTILNCFESDNFKIKIKKITIMPNNNMSYQYHNCRNENWYILNGTGEVIIDGIKNKINMGDTISINIGQKHSIKAIDKLEIIEVQYGTETKEEDIVRIEYNWNNIL